MAIINADWEGIRTAIDTIKSGYIVTYPTETFYGLGVDPYNEDALKRISELKGWKENRPISLLIDHFDRLNTIVTEVTPVARILIKHFWPGALTLVFKACPTLPSLLRGSTGKIGVRLSSNPVAMRLLNQLKSPLTTTSANPTGEKSALTAEDVEKYFGEKIPVILQGGKLKGVRGSTVLDVTGKEAAVLRAGDLPLEEIKRQHIYLTAPQEDPPSSP